MVVIRIFDTATQLAEAAALHASGSLRALLDRHPLVRLLVATGNSQLAFLHILTRAEGLDWSRVELFHLDEYVGIPETHPASFAGYIRERIIAPTGMRLFHLLDGRQEPQAVAARMSADLAASQPIHLAFAGIGENGHLAFNDPPADFETDRSYLVVELDERCRQQQVNEGWFASLDQVPRQAITISIPQLLQAQEIISVVPGKQKAEAVRACLAGDLTPAAPASALRLHPNATIYLDRESASLLPAPQPFPVS